MVTPIIDQGYQISEMILHDAIIYSFAPLIEVILCSLLVPFMYASVAMSVMDGNGVSCQQSQSQSLSVSVRNQDTIPEGSREGLDSPDSSPTPLTREVVNSPDYNPIAEGVDGPDSDPIAEDVDSPDSNPIAEGVDSPDSNPIAEGVDSPDSNPIAEDVDCPDSNPMHLTAEGVDSPNSILIPSTSESVDGSKSNPVPSTREGGRVGGCDGVSGGKERDGGRRWTPSVMKTVMWVITENNRSVDHTTGCAGITNHFSNQQCVLRYFLNTIRVYIGLLNGWLDVQLRPAKIDKELTFVQDSTQDL